MKPYILFLAAMSLLACNKDNKHIDDMLGKYQCTGYTIDRGTATASLRTEITLAATVTRAGDNAFHVKIDEVDHDFDYTPSQSYPFDIGIHHGQAKGTITFATTGKLNYYATAIWGSGTPNYDTTSLNCQK